MYRQNLGTIALFFSYFLSSLSRTLGTDSLFFFQTYLEKNVCAFVVVKTKNNLL